MSDSVFVVGAGRVGRGLIKEFQQSGLTVVGAWNRTQESARGTETATGLTPVWGRLPDTTAASVVVLAVPDRAIGSVVQTLVDEGKVTSRQVVLHVSGAVLSSRARVSPDCPRAVAAYHPLQTFAAPEEARRRYHVTLEGEPEAIAVGRRLAEATGHAVMEIDATNKALYHAAATVACNYVVTLQMVALRMAEQAGLPTAEAQQAFVSLLSGTAAAVEREGLQEGLTGPIARGDTATVASHLEALDTVDPELAALYRALGRRTLELRTEECEEIRELLQDR